MMMKLKPVLAALGLGIAAASANAAVVWFGGGTGFEDNNLEWFHLDVNNDGRLGVGDQLYSVITIETTFSTNPVGSSSPITGGQQLSGISAIQVTSAFGGAGGLAVPGTCSIISPCGYIFGEVAGGLQAILTTLNPGYAGPALAAGTLAALWLDSTTILDLVGVNCTSDADCTTKATDGSLWGSFGFGGDGDNLWLATGVFNDSLAAVAAGNATAKFGTYNYSMDVLQNGTGQVLVDVSCAPFCGTGAGADGLARITGSGDVLGGAGLAATGAFGRSDFDFQMKSVPVPEPGTLALVGLAFLGMGTVLRKRAR